MFVSRQLSGLSRVWCITNISRPIPLRIGFTDARKISDSGRGYVSFSAFCSSYDFISASSFDLLMHLCEKTSSGRGAYFFSVSRRVQFFRRILRYKNDCSLAKTSLKCSNKTHVHINFFLLFCVFSSLLKSVSRVIKHLV